MVEYEFQSKVTVEANYYKDAWKKENKVPLPHVGWTQKVLVRWSLEFETRDYGIKDFYTTIPRQSIVVSTYESGEDEEEEINEIERIFEIGGDLEYHCQFDFADQTLYPDSISFEFDENGILQCVVLE
jgi:hypothetical protein